ncbi:hypothetical protein GGR42_000289 [Saonia flava]|uniref:HEAT repeat domain-containing protein n=1 Tax=Saonia flava TaxID=523696 RepID=A0A846QRK4_9FLAO|nr:hypothetical protein [Saonia flava]NJB69827.1 hypothetical protein [Saonia flava]
MWDLTWLFLGLGTIYFASIFYFRNKIASKEKQVTKKKRELSPIISEFLFYEENATKEEKSNYIKLKIEIRELLKNDFNRQVLSEVLLDLQKDVSGNTEKRVFELYQDLGLHLDAYKKLRSWKWQVVSKGILELTQMEVFDSYSFIKKFINDKRSVIRKQAEIATVTLKNDGLSYFLDTTKYKISEWQQLKLLEVVRNHKDFDPPKFSAWLTSSNRHVVLFSLRLIKYYNQNQSYSSIIELVRHRNHQIKEEAISCIKKFQIIEAKDTLKSVFWKCNVHVKILILDTIASLGNKEDIGFLKLAVNRETNFVTKNKALSAINAIVPETIMPTEGIAQVDMDSIQTLKEAEDNFTAFDKALEMEDIDPNPIDSDTITLEDEIETNKIEKNLDNQDSTQELEGEAIATENTLEENLEAMEIESTLDIEISEEFEEQAEDVQEIEEVEQIEEEVEVDLGIEEKLNDTYLPPEVVITEEEEKELLENELGINFLPFVINEEEIEAEEFMATSTTNIFNNNFFEQDSYNKILLLDTLEDLGGKKEIPFLKEIIEKDTSETIRERALEILNEFSETEYHINKKDAILYVNNAPINGDSVFKQLFNTSDRATKLVLLDEIMGIGDKKELAFLNSLENQNDPTISEKVKLVKRELEKRTHYQKTASSDSNEENEILESDVIFPLNDQSFQLQQSITYNSSKSSKESTQRKNNKGQIPLEFCFLLDELEIELPKPMGIFNIDFELTEEFYKNQAKNVSYNKNKKKE